MNSRNNLFLSILHQTQRISLIVGVLILSAVPAFVRLHAEEAKTNELAQFYGFTGVELFKLDGRVANLARGDFDSDGRTDIVAVDNRASCLRFLRQQSDADIKKKRKERSVNDVQSDWRFDIRQIPVDKQMTGVVAGDFNSDGRVDLAYVGVPDRLVLRYQPEKGKTEWTQKWSVRLPEIEPVAWMIASGDLNGDSRTDIAILGKSVTYVVYQNDQGQMETPQSLINTSSQLSLLQIADLDGDGRNDLSYQANEGSSRGLCARLQTKDGRLGPELRFDLQQPRSVTLGDLDQQPGAEIMTIDNRTGRVLISRLTTAAAKADDVPRRLVQFGIGAAATSKGRAVAIGDIDGNRLADVVVTDPENAQVLVYRQNGIDGLETAEKFPSLLGGTDIAVVDIDKDGRSEVIVLSEKEAVIAVSRFENGRLTFPKVVYRPETGRTLAAMQFLEGEEPRLAVAMPVREGSKRTSEMQFLKVSPDTQWQSVGKPISTGATAIGSRGVSLLPIDFDKDGYEDVLLVPQGSGNKGVVAVPNDRMGTIQDNVKIKHQDLGIAAAGQLFHKDGHLYVARESFARKMAFESQQWVVEDQFNAGESRARIAGVAVLDLDGKPGDEIALVDTGIKKLRVLKLMDGLYRPWKEVDIGQLRYVSAHVADLNGDKRDDLLLLGSQQFAVLYAGYGNSQLEEVASYESDRDDAYPADVIVGDVNGDGQTDLAVIDTSIDGIDLLNFDAEQGLRTATHFRVFEEKRLVSESKSRGTEPREGMIVDVTGDGRDDLILLCHDRLILYPQDRGETD